MMRTALIGQRGVGKSTLLKRIESYFKSVGRSIVCLDLDAEIERRTGKSVRDLFANGGEDAFRQREIGTFRSLDEETTRAEYDVFVALGAGFDPAVIPNDWRALWIRRASDQTGRIFTDRPRLNSAVSPLAEFHERAGPRELRFRDRADEVLFLDEGPTEQSERDFFLDGMRNLGGAITLLPEMFRTHEGFVRWAKTRARWGVRWFELRDDLLHESHFELALQTLPHANVLLSFRARSRLQQSLRWCKLYRLAFDWPMELGLDDMPHEPTFISLHERRIDHTLSEDLARMPEGTGAILKAALPTNDFGELAEGWRWQKENLRERVFLPHSSDGRWQWYRLLKGPLLPLCFFRESDGSGVDQPTLLQWARRQRKNLREECFAAVLGDPVAHSRSPLEHHAYFESLVGDGGVSFFAIRVTAKEWQSGALDFLQSLGLRWAAVTAPLKTEAFSVCVGSDDALDEISRELGALNTLEWNEAKSSWFGANTDLIGFQAAIEEAGNLGNVAVWGGGGTLKIIQYVLQEAACFSARTGEIRTDEARKRGAASDTGVSETTFRPDTVIWSVGRSRTNGENGDGVKSPPAGWHPRLVVDLNYSEDSPGREYALACCARYMSGLTMFHAQAKAQQNFWSENTAQNTPGAVMSKL